VHFSVSRADPAPHDSRRSVVLSALAISLAAVAAYRGSFADAFLYDDGEAIVSNPTIRRIGTALFPPSGGLPVSGRPLVNFTFAINYGLAGLDVWGYHAVNLAIHILAGLALFGIVRRTLGRIAPAFVIALLWTVDPLQTAAVTYLSQRAESLMGLFYLLTIYCFIRAAGRDGKGKTPGSPETAAASAKSGEKGRRRTTALWYAAAWLACLCGVAAKEVMATAPLLVFLYDRTFVAGSFHEAWRRRGAFYLALATTWLPLAFWVARTSGRGGTAGFHSSAAWWAYAFTQFRAVAHYLHLSLWPRPLVFNYGLILGGPPWVMIRDIVLVAGLMAATVVLIIRGSPAGFLGAWFFVILAPSSSIVPVATEIIAEHRVYLSVAAVITAVVVGISVAAEHGNRRWGLPPRGLALIGLGSGIAVAGILGIATARRNQVYGSVLSLWADVVAKEPDNAGARNNYGNALAEQNRLDQAIAEYRAALSLVPDYDDPHYNLGNALAKQGHWGEAAEHYQAALRFRADEAEIHYALGSALRHLGRNGEAGQQYERALAGQSNSAALWYHLGNAFLETGRIDLAATAFGRAVGLQPNDADAQLNYAGALAQIGRLPDAVKAFQNVLRLDPDAADVHNDLGGLLAESGRLTEARDQFAAALRIKPDYQEARRNLERVEALERGRTGP